MKSFITAALESAVAAEGLGLQSTELQRGLELIEEIPEAVLLAGDDALGQWVAAKILKIKRLIDSLGGVTKAVRLFRGASFKWEKIQAIGGAAAALGAELLGIAAVKQKCFS
ncbi:hypothetical protein [Curtobacterium sp. VKM Ac-1393]|uniref:hypothetical protein n=1 Tax=Curtobacterium sp. VKM Ac-1393 TaxID=2783814 RepID=UPI00188B3481|nr:hypothetical protein [Curtobacterium sp. VKM Ac-1393]MBF4607720.1 hypothetical protein [Curtobacterium sp. VKM Ac-1393]